MLQTVGTFMMIIVIGLIFTSDKRTKKTWKERGAELLCGIIGLTILGVMFCGIYWIFNKQPAICTALLVAYLIYRFIQVHKKKDQR